MSPRRGVCLRLSISQCFTFCSRSLAGSKADKYNHAVRFIVISSRVVSTLAGAPPAYGFTDGVGSYAKFYAPSGIALDAAGMFAVVVSSIEGSITIRTRARL